MNEQVDHDLRARDKERLDEFHHELDILTRWYKLRQQGKLSNLRLRSNGNTLSRLTPESIASGFALMDWERITIAEIEILVQEIEYADRIRKGPGIESGANTRSKVSGV